MVFHLIAFMLWLLFATLAMYKLHNILDTAIFLPKRTKSYKSILQSPIFTANLYQVVNMFDFDYPRKDIHAVRSTLCQKKNLIF